MKKILVVRFSSLGDVVLVSPVFDNLKRTYPAAEIVFLTKNKYAFVFSHHPSVGRIMAIRSTAGYLRMIRTIKQEQFDCMIDLHRSVRSYILSWFGGFKKVIRYHKDSFDRRMLVWFHRSSPRLQKHTIDKYLAVLSQINVPVIPRDLSLRSNCTVPVNPSITVRNVIVVQTAFIGDAVLTMPLCEAIKKHWSCRLTVCAAPGGSELYRQSQSVDEIIPYDKKGIHKGLFSYVRLIQRIRAGHYDCAIIPHRSFRSALIAFLAGIPVRIGFDNSEGRMLLNHVVPFNWQDHDVQRNLSLLLPFDIHKPAVQWGMQVLRDEMASVDRIWKEQSWEKEKVVIGINPGSVWPTKRWLPERFARAAEHLHEKWHAGIILFGGPDDRRCVEQVVRSCACPVLDLCGKTPLHLLPALIGRCTLFITNDSGPMHIAVAAGVPTLAIFGPTTRELGFYPYGDKHQVAEITLSCRPCGLHGGKKCPKKHFKCMKDISAGDISEKADTMIAFAMKEKKPVAGKK